MQNSISVEDPSLSKIKLGIAGVKYAGEHFFGKSANVNLEALPSVYLENIIKTQRFIRWETQRGCPFRCSFCQHKEPDEVFMKRKHLDENRIFKEIEWICKNEIIQVLQFLILLLIQAHTI